MQNYELLFILPGTLSDEETAPLVEKVKGIVEKNNGKEYSLEVMDKKRLAYPIKQIRYGYFYLAFFQAESKEVEQMQKELRLITELLRVLVQKYDPKTQTMRKIDFGLTPTFVSPGMEGEAVPSMPTYSEHVNPVDYNAPSAPIAPTLATEAVPSVESPVVTTEDTPVVPSVPVKKADKKISLDEIDKKLDEILDIDLGNV